MNCWGRAALVWIGMLTCWQAPVAAQLLPLPSGPFVVGEGILTIGGDLALSLGSEDPGFYNYTDYQYSALQRRRAALTGDLRAGAHLSFLGELRVENRSAEVSALYARIKPWGERAFHIQVGRIPPTFGAFPRRTYAPDNPLIGSPLAYQYLTSLRPDSVPAHADELQRMRGRGWLSDFSIGDQESRRGMPLATPFRWDTGVQLHASTDVLSVAAAVTTGTLSNPLVTDDNGGRQYAARVTGQPATGLILGASVSHGGFLDDAAARAAGHERGESFDQDAWGADVEYSRGHYIVRAEALVSRWELPAVASPAIDSPLTASAVFVEGRYRLLPGLYAAARVERLDFSEVTGSSGARTWDAPVTRIELGGGYSIQRNLLLKASYQFNKRDTFRVPRSHLAAAEILLWF